MTVQTSTPPPEAVTEGTGQQNVPFMQRKVAGIPMPVVILGGAVLAAVVFFWWRNRSSSSSGSQETTALDLQAAASAQDQGIASAEVMLNQQIQQLQQQLQEAVNNEALISKQIDALSLQSYSEAQNIAGILGHPFPAPTWRGSPYPTAYPWWVLGTAPPGNQMTNGGQTVSPDAQAFQPYAPVPTTYNGSV